LTTVVACGKEEVAAGWPGLRVARENSDEVVCCGSGTVVFRGFQRYIEPLKTTRGRDRTEKDRVRYSPENTSGVEKKIKKKKLR
jgi:hypothetical protein